MRDNEPSLLPAASFPPESLEANLYRDPPAAKALHPGETHGLDPALEETVITSGVQSPSWWLRSAFGDEVELIGDTAVLGRHPDASLDVQVVAITDATRTTSKTHATLHRHGDAWSITDMSSSNGTVVGDNPEATPLAANVPTMFGDGVFWLGDVEFSVTRDVPRMSSVTMSPAATPTRDTEGQEGMSPQVTWHHDTQRPGATSPDATSEQAPGQMSRQATWPGDTLDVTPLSPSMSPLATGVDASYPSAASDATETATRADAMSRRGRRRVIVMLGAAGAAVVLTCAALVAVSLLSPGQATADSAQTRSSVATLRAVPGWSGDATWAVAGTAVPMTETRDSAYLGYVAGGAAVVLDAATGDTVAQVTLGEGAEPELYRVGDMLAGYDDTAIYLWAPEDTSWTIIERDKEQVVSIRGDSLFVVLEEGRSFGYPDGDSGLKTVLAPTKGAVPIGHTGETVHWGTNAKKLFVTTTSGAAISEAEMKPPVPDAALKKWVATTASYAFLLWEKDDGFILAAHDISNGDVASFDSAKEADPEASWLSTRNGIIALFGGKQIDTTTGAITSLPEAFSSRAIVGDQVYGGSEGEDAFLDLVTSEVRHVSHLEVVPLAGGPKGGLIAASNGQIYSFPMGAGTTGQKQQSSKETDS